MNVLLSCITTGMLAHSLQLERSEKKIKIMPTRCLDEKQKQPI